MSDSTRPQPFAKPNHALVRRGVAYLPMTLVLAFVGCAADVGAPDVTLDPALEDPVAAEADLREQCRSPRRYDGRPRSGRCTDVTSPSGTWRAKTIAADAPEGICSYEFRHRSGTTQAPSKTDLGALEAVAIAVSNCKRTPPKPVFVKPIPWFEDPSHGGAAGCDVCGLRDHRSKKTWVLIPPMIVTKKYIEVRLASGEVQAFELENVPDDATTVSVVLPPPPENDAWLPGTVRVR